GALEAAGIARAKLIFRRGRLVRLVTHFTATGIATSRTSERVTTTESGRLLPSEEAVLAVLTEDVKSAKQIASETGHAHASGQLYATLRGLCAKGLAERAPGGGFRKARVPVHETQPNRNAESERNTAIMDYEPSTNGHKDDRS